MKLKRLLSGALAGIIALMALSIPASAANTDIIFSKATGTTNYSIALSAEFAFAKVNFTTSDSATLSATGFSGTLADESGHSFAVAMDSVKINNAEMTNGATINFGFQNTKNQLIYGDTTKFTYTANATIQGAYATNVPNSTKDPVKDLGLDYTKTTLKDLKITIVVAGQPYELTPSSFTCKTVTTSQSVTGYATGSMILKDYANGGKGLKVVEQDAIKNATSNVTVTATLSAAATANNYYDFSTDISSIDKLTVSDSISKGETTLTFSVPATYLRATATEYTIAGDLFKYFIINKIAGADTPTITSVVFSVPTSGTAATTTTTTTKPADTTAPADEDEADAAEEDPFIFTNASNNKMTINAGTTFALETSYDDVTWSTSSKAIVKVYKSGKIKGMKAGTATVTAKNSDGKKIKLTVTVIESDNPSSEVMFVTKSTGKKTTGGRITMKKVGNTVTLTTKLTDEDSTDKVNFTTSDPELATVSTTGKVTLKAAGVVYITAITSSGETASYKLTIKAA